MQKQKHGQKPSQIGLRLPMNSNQCDFSLFTNVIRATIWRRLKKTTGEARVSELVDGMEYQNDVQQFNQSNVSVECPALQKNRYNKSAWQN